MGRGALANVASGVDRLTSADVPSLLSAVARPGDRDPSPSPPVVSRGPARGSPGWRSRFPRAETPPAAGGSGARPPARDARARTNRRSNGAPPALVGTGNAKPGRGGSARRRQRWSDSEGDRCTGTYAQRSPTTHRSD